MSAHRLTYVYVAWIFFYAYWLIASSQVKRNRRAESPATRIPYTILILLAYFLLFDPQLSLGFLADRFIARSPEAELGGLAVTIAGACFAVWARLTIGRNWSSNVTIKQDHELIQRGPYTFVRHPIYTGILTMTLGTAIAIGEIRCLIGLIVAFVSFRIKSRIEERFMTEQFGEKYDAYKAQVKALIPFVY